MGVFIVTDYKLAKTNLKRIRKTIESPTKSGSKLVKEVFRSIRPDRQTLESDNFSMTWTVRPKIDFSDLMDGEFINAIDNTEVRVKLAYDIDSDVELRLEVCGKPFRLESDGEIRFSAVTRF